MSMSIILAQPYIVYTLLGYETAMAAKLITLQCLIYFD